MTTAAEQNGLFVKSRSAVCEQPHENTIGCVTVLRSSWRKLIPYPADHRHLTTQKIVRSARRLFNRHGFDAVSIDDVMADAGLTRGSFYSYFESKGDLYSEAVTYVLNEKQLLSSDGVTIDARAVDNAAQFIRDYLSLEHFEDIDGSCPLIAFPTEFLRKEARVRQAFETVLRVMIDVFEQALQRNGQAARNRARAIAAMCVGGMVMARSIEDRAFADELREAAMDVALFLGQWPRRTSEARPQYAET
jgi:TetR/AcrR family transcriptional regulator, transcriptional repressor for nem operon